MRDFASSTPAQFRLRLIAGRRRFSSSSFLLLLPSSSPSLLLSSSSLISSSHARHRFSCTCNDEQDQGHCQPQKAMIAMPAKDMRYMSTCRNNKTPHDRQRSSMKAARRRPRESAHFTQNFPAQLRSDYRNALNISYIIYISFSR